MKKNISAGLVMCQWKPSTVQFFLVHPGGPFFKNKDAGAWTIPKGLPEEGEDLLTTAQREFFEETGITPTGPLYQLEPIKQKGGKTVYAWTFLGEWDEQQGIQSNYFDLEWPPKSGRFQKFPEQDKAAWMSFEEAAIAINPSQLPLLVEAKNIHEQNAPKK